MNKWNKTICQRKKPNRGAAMIVVICVMSVVMILSLTLLMSAYQMFATVNDEGKDELYYQQAMSFSEVLRGRMVSSGTSDGMLDELKPHINTFMGDAATMKETLKSPVPSGSAAYGGITLTLDKSALPGYLVVSISVDDGDAPMAGCTCMYKAQKAAGTWKYTFEGYY